MKVVILAGGLGTRLSEETDIRPKPMVEIGGRPILWHIMKHYSTYGLHEFVLCLGYKGYFIKEYFSNYFLHTSDISVDVAQGKIEVHNNKAEPWRVTMIDTGELTQTGGRIKAISEYLDDDDFCLTYGDGVSNVNIKSLLEFHRAHGKYATVTAARPPGRFGALRIEGTAVTKFEEKPIGDGGFINAGFFVLSKRCLSYIKDENTVWEQHPLCTLAEEGNLQAFKHEGFWHPMDTLRDRRYLESLWQEHKAPWKVW